MKIQSVKVVHLQVPLRSVFSQANNTTQHSDAAIIVVTTENGISGYGESCPRTYVTGETVASVAQNIRNICDRLLTHSFNGMDSIHQFTLNQKYQEMGLSATCGLELALLDAWGKEKQNSIFHLLQSKPPEKVNYSGIIPFGKMEKIVPILEFYHFKDIKIKVNNNLKESLSRISTVKNTCPRDVTIRIDANCSWNYSEAMEQIPAFIKAGITTIEQPFPKETTKDMGKVTAQFGKDICIMADESLCSFEDAVFLAENNLCNGFNLKISKNGGIFNTLRITELADQFGIPYQLGAHFGETSILTMAGLVTNSSATSIQNMEGGFGTLLLQRDICKTSVQFDNQSSISPKNHNSMPGLGLEIDSAIFNRKNPDSLYEFTELAYYRTESSNFKKTFWF